MKHLILIISLAIFSAVALAENITLDEVISDSLQKNTSLYRIQREHEDKLANATEITLLENPELSVGAIHTKGENGIGMDLELSQPLKLSQLTGARIRYGDTLTQVANIEQKYEMLKVINETTMLYTRVWLLFERKKLYESYADDADQMRKLVQDSTSQGQTSPAASYLFSADAEKLRTDAKALDAELRQARSSLGLLTGRSYISTELQRPTFTPITANIERLQQFANTHANFRNIVESRIEAAERRIKIANQDAVLPEITPRLFYSNAPSNEEDFFAEDETFYGVGIALRIPIWNQNNAERSRANAELAQAQYEEDLLTGLPQKDLIEELRQSASIMQERADSYFKNILPTYRESYELTRSMFRQGQANALEVWQVREKLLTAENEALDAVAQAINARGALELELGGKIEEIL
ncbi:MAG: TolC family protein [Legionellales bacterium]